jgi:HrpA-like RNA helicase
MFQPLFNTLGALPVAGIAADVAAKVLGGTVTIVASATGSGKTLLLPASLAFAGGQPVVVLVPRRFLAVNAAETVADLSDLTVGQEVGYAVGAQSGEESRRSADGAVLYCTYGYAIASNLIRTAPVVVMDEVHEASMDMSICRALLDLRLKAGENVRVLEMSATINAERQAAYWQQVASADVVAIDGRTFPCERLHRPASKPEDAVKELLEKGRTGILVFRPGRGEVEETAAAIRALVGEDVEVAEIYGELDYASRKAAVAAPKGKAKVLVGTNVVESGANIPWLDAGVTCGTAKEIVVRPETGATFLKLIELPRWRLDQQEGRVKRFRDGIFVLCSPLAYEAREAETTPEIRRLPLTELVMHCASFGLRAEDLRFDYAPETARIVEAETKLQRLGLLDADCRLTKAGKWVSGMPVGPETGAMLWHAKNTGVLGAALPLAAVIEVDGVRKDFREPHGLDSTSDWLDALKAFKLALAAHGNERKDTLEQYNIGFKRFEAAKEMLKDLQRRFNGDASSTMQANDSQLKLCLVAGFITSLFQGGYSLTQLMGDRYSSYNVGNGSAASYLRGGYALGQLRTIQPKDRRKSAFTVVEKVTDVSLDDIVAVAKVRPSLITTETERVKVGYYAFQTVITRKLFGAYELKVEKTESPLTSEEQAAKAAFEATRATLRQQLDALNPLREELGLERIRHEDEAFRFGYYGSRYAYTAEDVARAEDDNANAIEARRAELEAARLKAERIAAIRPQFEALSQLRKDAGLSELYLDTERFHDQRTWFDYTAESLEKLTAALEAHKATQQADAERLAREAAEAQAKAEAEEAARREEESKRQQAIAAGKARIEKLNRRREALGWDVLSDCGEDFWFGGRYVAYTDDEGIQQAEREVVAEERKLADEAKRAESAMTNRDALAAMLGSKFAVSRR